MQAGHRRGVLMLMVIVLGSLPGCLMMRPARPEPVAERRPEPPGPAYQWHEGQWNWKGDHWEWQRGYYQRDKNAQDRGEGNTPPPTLQPY